MKTIPNKNFYTVNKFYWTLKFDMEVERFLLNEKWSEHIKKKVYCILFYCSVKNFKKNLIKIRVKTSLTQLEKKNLKIHAPNTDISRTI